MDYQQRDQNRQPIRRLIRGADGRLRSAAANSDIGDIWAEQRRIRLSEAIQEDQKKAEKLNKRKSPKEITVNIGLPKLRLPRFSILKRLAIGRKGLVIGGLAVLVTVAGVAGYQALDDRHPTKVASNKVLATEDLSQTPEYRTVLPEGKTIEDLGGWARVSPPDKDPVFAYVDAVDGVQLNVSQQPLPDSFRRDTAGELAKLAGQFSANQRIDLGDTTIYAGTSSKGPQSVITTIDDLLILIKSSGPLSDEQWAAYISELR